MVFFLPLLTCPGLDLWGGGGFFHLVQEWHSEHSSASPLQPLWLGAVLGHTGILGQSWHKDLENWTVSL